MGAGCIQAAERHATMQQDSNSFFPNRNILPIPGSSLTSPWRSPSTLPCPPTPVASACSPATPSVPPPTSALPWSPSRSLHRKGYFQQHSTTPASRPKKSSPGIPPTSAPKSQRASPSPSKTASSPSAPGATTSSAAPATSSPSSCSTPTSKATPPGTAASPTISTAATPTTACSRRSFSASAASPCSTLSACNVNVYHMNEGHAALLTLALLESQLGGGRSARHRGRHRPVRQQVRLHHPHARSRRPRPVLDASRPSASSATTAPRALKSSAASTTAC